MTEETIQTIPMHRNSMTNEVLFRTFSLNVAKHVNRLHSIVGNYLQNILPPKQFVFLLSCGYQYTFNFWF